MAASHIALRARSYGSFPVSADVHDAGWLQHSHERIAARRSLDHRKITATAFSHFLDAFPVLRDASQHLRALIMSVITLKKYATGETMNDAKSPSLVFILAGEATAVGVKNKTIPKGQGFGEGNLWGETTNPTLVAKSRTVTALVLVMEDFVALKLAIPEHFVEFDKQLQLRRAWHRGESEDGCSMASEEVQDLTRSLVRAVQSDDSVTIRKIARDRKMLLDVADPYALEGGAMHVATLQMDHSSLDLLLELNASPNARNGSVALAGDAMALKKLLGAQGKPNTSDLKLRTPLHVAAQEGHADVVKGLLKAGANVDVQDSRLSTPIHVAVRHGHADVVKALLLAGCNLNKKDHHGRNVWNEAREWKDADSGVDDLCKRQAVVMMTWMHSNNGNSSIMMPGRAAIYDMVNLVFTREACLKDWSHPCCERDRSYLDMPEPEPAPEPEAPPKPPPKPNFNLV